MRQTITIQDILKTACGHLNQHLNAPAPKSKIKKREKFSKEKYSMDNRLREFTKENNLELSTEKKFHPDRKWKFDWSIDEWMVAFEYEGLFSEKSRHTTVKGFTGDTEKYNAAQELGWKVYRYTALNYLNLMIDLEKLKNGINK